MRTLLALGTRGRAFRRRLPPSLGGAVFPASTDGGLKHLRLDAASIDPMLTGFAKRFVKPGMVVWDVGANVGLFTFAAAGLAGPSGRVVAVEADIRLAGNLRRAAAWNTDGKKTATVDVVPTALAGSVGVAEFNIAKAAGPPTT